MQTNQNYSNTNLVYADFGKRLVAYLIDSIIISVPVGIIYAVLISLFAGSMATSIDPETGAMSSGAVGGLMGVMVVIYILVPVIIIAYFAYFESSDKQASLGKQAMGLKVVNLNGDKISFMNAVGRNAARLISGAVCAIGYIMAAFTEKKQALHDMIAGTLVVTK